jgi:hypothetical protein
MPRIQSPVKIEHIAWALIQNPRFAVLATAGDIFNRPRWTPCGAVKRRSSTFLARGGPFLSGFMTIGLWIGVDKKLAPFRETARNLNFNASYPPPIF